VGIQEPLILLMSRAPEARDYHAGNPLPVLETALVVLEREYPDLAALVGYKRVAHFGLRPRPAVRRTREEKRRTGHRHGEASQDARQSAADRRRL
jgi:hypothetical protein